MQQPMHDHMIIRYLEVNPVVLCAEAVQRFAVPLNFTEAVTIQLRKVGLCHLEGVQQLELVKRSHLGDFSRADFIENNL